MCICLGTGMFVGHAIQGPCVVRGICFLGALPLLVLEPISPSSLRELGELGPAHFSQLRCHGQACVLQGPILGQQIHHSMP